MTNKQYKICRIILRHKTLEKILKRLNFVDYEELEIEMLPFTILIDDGNIVTLEDNILLEEFESRKRDIWRDYITWALSVCAIIISIISLIITCL